MIERYENEKITEIFSDKHKLALWQQTEFAVLRARVLLGFMGNQDYVSIINTLENIPIDLEWWRKRDKEIHHDLNAFIDERIRHLEPRLHQFFHKNITSYDTEEPAFARTLSKAIEVILQLSIKLKNALALKAATYRFTIMNARTHGQEAGLASFGGRCLSWYADYQIVEKALVEVIDNLKYSKLSGITGRYGNIDPLLEKTTLKLLGLEPYYGATQIMPRALYAPIAQSLSNLVSVLDKIAGDIRLAARSGNPIMQEPFAKKQKGSSAMPHKKNTIRAEQIAGMARLARGYMLSLSENIFTWEERAIEQSSVERVAWPDLFHVTARALEGMELILSGLKVYPDNMLKEIHESRGVYASGDAKEFLKEAGLNHEVAYRIVQLACFNVFEPGLARMKIRETIPTSFNQANEMLNNFKSLGTEKIVSIEKFIPKAHLHVSASLEATPKEVSEYNKILKKIFFDPKAVEKWHALFTPEYQLRNEGYLYEKIKLTIESISE